jgi:hypothetical protein
VPKSSGTVYRAGLLEALEKVHARFFIFIVFHGNVRYMRDSIISVDFCVPIGFIPFYFYKLYPIGSIMRDNQI